MLQFALTGKYNLVIEQVSPIYGLENNIKSQEIISKAIRDLKMQNDIK